MKVLVTMGFFDTSGECRLAEVDLERGSWETLLSFFPPEPLRVAEKGFTGAAWSGEPGSSMLFVCSSNAVFLVDPKGFNVVDTWHQRCMNDLHHVALTANQVYVVNTGLEAIDVFSPDGLFLGSHALHPGWISAQRQAGLSPARDDWASLLDARWPRRIQEIRHDEPRGDYYTTRVDSANLPFSRRKLRDYAHPNHVVPTETQLLVTRFLDRAIDNVFRFERVIADTPGLPHDGIVDNDRFWITCVNGLVVAYAMEHGRVTAREIERIDLFESGPTGWCRGLLVTPEHVVAGLSEIRRMPRYRWCDRPVENTETSISVLHRRSGKLEQRILFREENRQAKIFSVLPLPIAERGADRTMSDRSSG